MWKWISILCHSQNIFFLIETKTDILRFYKNFHKKFGFYCPCVKRLINGPHCDTHKRGNPNKLLKEIV